MKGIHIVKFVSFIDFFCGLFFEGVYNSDRLKQSEN